MLLLDVAARDFTRGWEAVRATFKIVELLGFVLLVKVQHPFALLVLLPMLREEVPGVQVERLLLGMELLLLPGR